MVGSHLVNEKPRRHFRSNDFLDEKKKHERDAIWTEARRVPVVWPKLSHSAGSAAYAGKFHRLSRGGDESFQVVETKPTLDSSSSPTSKFGKHIDAFLLDRTLSSKFFCASTKTTHDAFRVQSCSTAFLSIPPGGLKTSPRRASEKHGWPSPARIGTCRIRSQLKQGVRRDVVESKVAMSVCKLPGWHQRDLEMDWVLLRGPTPIQGCRRGNFFPLR